MIFDDVLAAVAYAEEHNMCNYEIRRMEDGKYLLIG